MPVRCALGALLVLIPRLALAGVTIHYEGKVASDAALKGVLDEAVAFARERGWPVAVRSQGVVLQPHTRSEPIELFFQGRALLPSWVKTQFAGLDTHIAIIDLFRPLAPRLQELSVDDEGDYWETRDRKALLTAFQQVDDLLARELRRPGASGPYQLPSGRIVDLVTGPAPRNVRALSPPPAAAGRGAR